MATRRPIGKKLRFEVFKRDKFTCQYCGAKAPDVVLHVDHIHPVAKGGKNDILNLVSSCQGCNSGKGDRLIDDESAVEMQRARIEELAQRREQIKMIVSWRDELEAEAVETVDIVNERIKQRGAWGANENGRMTIRRMLKLYTLKQLLQAVDEAFDSYMRWNGDDPDEKAWEKAFSKIQAICSILKQSEEKPYVRKIAYIQGIMRRKFRNKHENFFEVLERMHVEWGAPLDVLQEEAMRVVDRAAFVDAIAAHCGVTLPIRRQRG